MVKSDFCRVIRRTVHPTDQYLRVLAHLYVLIRQHKLKLRRSIVARDGNGEGSGCTPVAGEFVLILSAHAPIVGSAIIQIEVERPLCISTDHFRDKSRSEEHTSELQSRGHL